MRARLVKSDFGQWLNILATVVNDAFGTIARTAIRGVQSMTRDNSASLYPIANAIYLWTIAPLTCGTILAIPVTAFACMFPVMLPLALLMFPVLVFVAMYGIAWTSYILLAQKDRPSYTMLGVPSLTKYIPFLPVTPQRCFKVTKAVLGYIWSCCSIMSMAKNWFLLYKQHKARPGSESIIYSMPFSRQQLDVYPPTTSTVDASDVRRNAPVLVLVPDAIVPVTLTSHRKMYLPLATRMQQLGYCVVVPQITYYPADQIRQSVIDLRLALSWVGAHIFHYAGDPSRIYVMGHGLSAELVALTLVQEAVVLSQTIKKHRDIDDATNHDLTPKSNIIEQETFNKQLEIYAPQVRLPNIAGVILLAGHSDVIKSNLNEADLGIEHLSSHRRWTGPQQFQCLLHSPTHLLMHSKACLDPTFLPPKFLLIHGGLDKLVPISQAILLRSLLLEIGVKNAELLAFRKMNHFDTFKLLLASPPLASSKYEIAILKSICSFVA